jgi:hypothetical protein
MKDAAFLALYQGTTLVGPYRPEKELGFSPCLEQPARSLSEENSALWAGEPRLVDLQGKSPGAKALIGGVRYGPAKAVP